ncbi:MAG: ferredoxin family protein [Lachnospiraceae bacterium]|nr:ferredoxin family protein [Lachnospiraceae bacterium]
MSVMIDTDICKGCGACAEVCPGNLIRIRQGEKAFLPHPEECWGCASCLKACRAGAVTYYLGADIGGRGARMRVVEEGRFSHWIITLPQHADHQSGSGENPAGSRKCAGAGAGRTVTITVDRSDANRY